MEINLLYFCKFGSDNMIVSKICKKNKERLEHLCLDNLEESMLPWSLQVPGNGRGWERVDAGYDGGRGNGAGMSEGSVRTAAKSGNDTNYQIPFTIIDFNKNITSLDELFHDQLCLGNEQATQVEGNE